MACAVARSVCLWLCLSRVKCFKAFTHTQILSNDRHLLALQDTDAEIQFLQPYTHNVRDRAVVVAGSVVAGAVSFAITTTQKHVLDASADGALSVALGLSQQCLCICVLLNAVAQLCVSLNAGQGYAAYEDLMAMAKQSTLPTIPTPRKQREREASALLFSVPFSVSAAVVGIVCNFRANAITLVNVCAATLSWHCTPLDSWLASWMVAFPCAAFAHIRLTNQRFAYDDPGDWATHAWEVLNARGIVVYEHKNDLTGLVTVTEHARRWRALRFNGNIQSITRVVWKQDSPSVLFAHGCVLNEYVKVMASSLFSFNSASICQPRLQCDMLFLGLGAGTLPMFCVEHMTHATLTAVEFDPVVVQTAREFAGLSGNVPVLIGDAAQILQGLADNSEATQLYDAICVDVFDGDNLTPVPCRDAVFVRNVYRALRDDGVVVINCHTNSVTASPVSGSNAVSAVDVVFQQTLKIYMDAFPNVYCVPVRFTGNTIIVAHKSCRALERSEILEAARKAAREIGARFDFCRLLKDITRTNP